jgi:hypothetical protein
MANRMFHKNYQTLEPSPVELFVWVNFGAGGAPTLDSTKSKGVKSVTRNSTGDLTFTFGANSASAAAATVDIYKALLSASVVFDETSNSGTAPLAPSMFVKNNLVSTSAGTVEVVLNSAGTPTDPASGEKGMFRFVFSNTSAI